MAAAPGLQTFDRRRFTGPESSRPISYEAPGKGKGKERLEGDKDRDFQREDEGRGDGDVRPICECRESSVSLLEKVEIEVIHSHVVHPLFCYVLLIRSTDRTGNPSFRFFVH